jgi:mannose-6-phosphate isomerase
MEPFTASRAGAWIETKLNNTVKHYDWGSPEWIPELMGLPNEDGSPWAELWMGVHPEGPSMALLAGEKPLLHELIARDTRRYLGDAASYGGLPFLFKILAAARPLSIQAHPDLARARAGFAEENRRGVALNAPNRNYKDPNHKPEILCALTPFTAMGGFREIREIGRLLEALNCPVLAPLLTGLNRASSAAEGLRDFLGALLGLGPEARGELTRRALALALEEAPAGFEAEWKYAAYFAELYPDDPAVIAPFYLNLFQLQPGEAVYIPSGVLHAYIHGLGVELMANSDNVLRGGLTPKHIDLPELSRILTWAPMKPEILHPTEAGPGLTAYNTPAREFRLFCLAGNMGPGTRGVSPSFPDRGPLIVLAVQGEARLRFRGAAATGELTLNRGESAFVAARQPGEELDIAGASTLYAAGIGASPA